MVAGFGKGWEEELGMWEWYGITRQGQHFRQAVGIRASRCVSPGTVESICRICASYCVSPRIAVLDAPRGQSIST
jgi:hypothetical protein